MNKGKILDLSLFAIAIITIVSGLLQLIMPSLVLQIVSAETTPTSQHFFAIIGMFMLLFGGALLQALISPQPQAVVLIWAGLQKFGAAIAVGLGVIKLIFSPFALLIAGFDLLSGVLIFWYLFGFRSFAPGYTYEQPTS